MAAKSVLRQEDLDFVDPRLQFGWHGSPGWWGVIAGTVHAAHRATTWVSEAMMSHVGVARPTGKVVEPLLPECRVPRVQGGAEGTPRG